NLDIQRLKRTEQALQESEEKLRIFGEHAPAAIAMLDGDLRYLSVSRRWLTDYVASSRDIIGLSHYEVFSDLPEKWKGTLRRCLAGAVERNEADPWVRADGNTEWLRWEVRPWFKSDSSIGGLIIFAENINDLKTAEEATRKSEGKYRLLFQNMSEGFALYQLLFDDEDRPVDWRVLEVNEAYEHHTGIPREKVVGHCVSEVFPDVVHQYLPRFARVVATQRAEDFDTYVKDTGRWLHVITFPAGPGRFANTITDITPRVRAEQAQRRMNDELEARVSERTAQVVMQAKEIADLYNNAPCGYHSLDGNGVIIGINNTELQWLGYSRSEVVGIKTFTDFLTTRSRNIFAENFSKLKTQGWIQDLEIEVIRKDGSKFTALVSATTVRDEKGNYVASRSTMFDISSRKENERKIIATNDLLKLFSSAATCEGYLNDAAELIRRWTDCFCVGICLLDENGDVSRGAYAGTAKEVWEKEVCLFAGEGTCTAVLNDTDIPECPDSPCVACNGMFVCNDVSQVLSPENGPAEKTLAGRSKELGFLSIAIIPVRYREKMLGSIHLADRRKNCIPRQTVELMELITPLIGEAIYRFSVEESLMVSREQLRSLSLHLLTAREEERTLVAREIHDELGQTLTAVRIELSLLKKNLQKKDIADRKLQSATDLIDSALEDVHKICAELRPRVLDHLGLEAAMEWQAKRFSDSAGLSCFLEFPPQHVVLPSVVSIAMFRIFQEALTNVVRHAQATSVFVRLALGKDSIRLEMKDNGKGISPEDIAGMHSFGIMGMRERARELGGDCVFTSDQSRGTTVAVTIPLGKGRDNVQNSDRR
ncbi:MAG TPA: PAS domain S-box protein, partial [Thermodesulfovibrionales bacterium]|nr:PAS domain S-box protein [Thermodesulfovibrionales bacterium]